MCSWSWPRGMLVYEYAQIIFYCTTFTYFMGTIVWAEWDSERTGRFPIFLITSGCLFNVGTSPSIQRSWARLVTVQKRSNQEWKHSNLKVSASHHTHITYLPHKAAAEVSNHHEPIGRKCGMQFGRKSNPFNQLFWASWLTLLSNLPTH